MSLASGAELDISSHSAYDVFRRSKVGISAGTRVNETVFFFPHTFQLSLETNSEAASSTAFPIIYS
jgi:hypothetical protein